MIAKRISIGLAVACFILGAAQLLKYAQNMQWLDADASRRTMQVIIGLILAAYGNYMPKEVAVFRGNPRGTAWSQSVMRLGGWSLMVAGLGQAIVWTFAPVAFADVASLIIVATATLGTAVYAVWAAVNCRRTGNSGVQPL